MVNALFMENWTVSEYEMTDTELVIEARYDLDPPACPRCGVVGAKFHRHAPYVIAYKDAPTFGKATTINVATDRLKCMECKKTFMRPLPDMADGFMMTRRCVEFIERESVTETWAKIGRRVGIDEKTVRTIARAAASRHLEERGVTAPLLLGIDELRLDGELRTIFIDGQCMRVLDILESQDKRLVYHWLSWLPHREAVRIVTMDMYGPYRDAVEQLMPQAWIIVDRFHVQRAINKALDDVRVRVARSQRTKKAQKAMMRGRNLLNTSRHRLSPRAAFVLDGLLANNPVLKDAWEMKERLYDVWACKTEMEAELAFLQAEASIPDSVKPEFGAFCAMVKRWWLYIFPYFTWRYTNALTETANGIVKIANRAGRGYAFEQIRAKALAYEPISAKFRFICEACLQEFDPDERSLIRAGYCICPDCIDTPTGRAVAELDHSTLTSG